MTYDPKDTAAVRDKLLFAFERGGGWTLLKDAADVIDAALAARDARPVPESALEIVEKVRGINTRIESATGLYSGPVVKISWDISDDDAAAIIQSYADAARASDRALIEEAARDIDALLLTPEISDCDPRDKDTETQVVERNARATLAKLRSYGNAN